MIVASAAAATRKQQKRLEGVDARITRGANSVEVKATIGETRTEEIIQDSVVVTTRARDYLVDAQEYDFGSGPVEPARADQIIETINDAEITWITTEDQSDTIWRWHDRQRKIYRIHTVESRR